MPVSYRLAGILAKSALYVGYSNLSTRSASTQTLYSNAYYNGGNIGGFGSTDAYRTSGGGAGAVGGDAVAPNAGAGGNG